MPVYFLQYFGEPAGQAKIQVKSKNMQPYYTLKCLISYLLSNCFDSEFCKLLNQMKADKMRAVTRGA